MLGIHRPNKIRLDQAKQRSPGSAAGPSALQERQSPEQPQPWSFAKVAEKGELTGGHVLLKTGTLFCSWKTRSKRDFVPFSVSSEKGHPRTDYYVTFDAAKQIGMMCGTDKGFEIRDYLCRPDARPQGFENGTQAILTVGQ